MCLLFMRIHNQHLLVLLLLFHARKIQHLPAEGKGGITLSIEAIGEVLHVNGSLTSLNLKYNGIHDEAKEALKEAAKARDSLKIDL